jgi:hypothetical protein
MLITFLLLLGFLAPVPVVMGGKPGSVLLALSQILSVASFLPHCSTAGSFSGCSMINHGRGHMHGKVS